MEMRERGEKEDADPPVRPYDAWLLTSSCSSKSTQWALLFIDCLPVWKWYAKQLTGRWRAVQCHARCVMCSFISTRESQQLYLIRLHHDIGRDPDHNLINL